MIVMQHNLDRHYIKREMLDAERYPFLVTGLVHI
jgi:hypothetical protein